MAREVFEAREGFTWLASFFTGGRAREKSQKLAKSEKNWQKLAKIGKNRRFSASCGVFAVFRKIKC